MSPFHIPLRLFAAFLLISNRLVACARHKIALMIQPPLSFLSRCLSFLPFLFALVFSLRGAAPFINNALYINYKIFISWVVIGYQSDNPLIAFQSDDQRFWPIFYWTIAGGFLILGIILHRRTTSSRPIEFNQLETTRKTWLHSPAIRILLCISAYLLIGYLCLLGVKENVNNYSAVVYEESLSSHVYLLSVEQKSSFNGQQLAPGENAAPELFKFEVSQCDASGWFCHVICDGYHNVYITPFINTPSDVELVDAHLQADASHHRLFILYHGEGTSHSGKLLCPIPPS